MIGKEREVALFGKLADPLGAFLRVDGGERDEPVGIVRARVAALAPQLGELLVDPRVRACIDSAVASDNARVAPGSPVEFIPAVSGG